MDLRMPIMDGYEACREIRRLDRKDASRVPIIAMTADAFEEQLQAAKQAGMDGAVTKPIDPQRLFEELTRLIQGNANG
jgi:CheY-like chemotaxis protein